MKTAFECFQEAAKRERMAEVAQTDEDRFFLLDAARHWRLRGQEAATAEAGLFAPDKPSK